MSTSLTCDPIVLPRRRYVRAIGPRLRILLWIVFSLGGLLAANTAYLLGVRLLEAIRGVTYQNYFYQCMFLAHLLVGLLVVVPFIVFGIGHIRNSHDRPQRQAVRIGYALFAICLILLFSGLALVRFEPLVINDPRARLTFTWLTLVRRWWRFGFTSCIGWRVRASNGSLPDDLHLEPRSWSRRCSCFTRAIRANGTSPARVKATSISAIARPDRLRKFHPRPFADERCLLHGMPQG